MRALGIGRVAERSTAIHATDPTANMAKPQPVTREPRLAAVISAPMIVVADAPQFAMFSMAAVYMRRGCSPSEGERPLLVARFRRPAVGLHALHVDRLHLEDPAALAAHDHRVERRDRAGGRGHAHGVGELQLRAGVVHGEEVSVVDRGPEHELSAADRLPGVQPRRDDAVDRLADIGLVALETLLALAELDAAVARGAAAGTGKYGRQDDCTRDFHDSSFRTNEGARPLQVRRKAAGQVPGSRTSAMRSPAGRMGGGRKAMPW